MNQSYTNSNYIASLKNWGAVAPNKSDDFPWGPVIVAFLGGVAVAGMYNQFRFKLTVAKMESMLYKAKK